MAKKSRTGPQRNFVSPREASERLGVTTQTLRNWARKGKISFITLPSGHRHYNVDVILGVMSAPVAFAPEKPVERAPEAPRAVEVAPVAPVITPEIAASPLGSALAKILTNPPADAYQQIAALLEASNPNRPKPVEFPPKSQEDVRAAIEALVAI